MRRGGACHRIRCAGLRQGPERQLPGGEGNAGQLPTARRGLFAARAQKMVFLTRSLRQVLCTSSPAYQEALLAALWPFLADLAVSRFGCYVARAVVEHPRTHRATALEEIRMCLPELRKTKRRAEEQSWVPEKMGSPQRSCFSFGFPLNPKWVPSNKHPNWGKGPPRECLGLYFAKADAISLELRGMDGNATKTKALIVLVLPC